MDVSVALYWLGLIVGLFGLWWSSEKSVETSIKLSDLLGITTFFIGFVLMAVATGLPELAIAIASIWKHVPSVSAGDIIGSNLIDVSLVLGIPAVFLGTLNVKKEDKLPLLLMLVVTAFVMALIFIVGELNLLYGIILILIYLASIRWLWVKQAIRVIPEEEAVAGLRGNNVKKRAPWSEKAWIFAKLFFYLFLVILFSKIAVDCVVVVTTQLGLRIEAIGVTIFALGTSLPEIALCIHAVRKKEYALAFGNSFGSVLEQATLILGILAIGSRQRVDLSFFRPIAPIMFLSYAIVIHALLKKTKVGRQEGLGRKEGLALLGLFLIHLLYYLVWAT